MRVSLKWKFGALMVGFVLTISLIILINFRTAGTVANELNRVQTQSFPQFSRVTSMEARFRTMSRLLEDTIVLGDRSFLDRALSQDGLKVVEASNGREALERLSESPPSLILLDLMMPEMDGFGFIAELRKDRQWDDIPVVVLTAMDLSTEDRQRLEGSATAVMFKKEQSQDILIREMRDLIQRNLASEVSA